MTADRSAEPADDPTWFALPDDLDSLSDEEIARLAAGIWAAFVSPQTEPEPPTDGD